MCSRGRSSKVDERFFLEQLDLPAGRDDCPRTAVRARAVGDGLLQRPRQDQGVGRIETGGRNAEELGWVHEENARDNCSVGTGSECAELAHHARIVQAAYRYDASPATGQPLQEYVTFTLSPTVMVLA